MACCGYCFDAREEEQPTVSAPEGPCRQRLAFGRGHAAEGTMPCSTACPSPELGPAPPPLPAPQGRQFPVQVMYTAAPEDSYVDAAITAALQVRCTDLSAAQAGAAVARMPPRLPAGRSHQLPPCPASSLPLSPSPSPSPQVHCDEGPGDILVFLTGQEEIEACERLITERGAALPPDPARPALLVLPIYAALPPEQQLRVFAPAPPNTRKVRPAGQGRSLPCCCSVLFRAAVCPGSAHACMQLKRLAGSVYSTPPGHPVHQHRRNVHHHRGGALRGGHRIRQVALLLPPPRRRLPAGGLGLARPGAGLPRAAGPACRAGGMGWGLPRAAGWGVEL